ncbi:MAG: hypothetical protein IPJ84_19150 [Bdellovibrionales bacterium]|nr:hypothetical protein [Bdellovibrionales bacterium]
MGSGGVGGLIEDVTGMNLSDSSGSDQALSAQQGAVRDSNNTQRYMFDQRALMRSRGETLEQRRSRVFKMLTISATSRRLTFNKTLDISFEWMRRVKRLSGHRPLAAV